MKFDEVIVDLRKMVGLSLESIRAGSNIVLTGVHLVEDRIELSTIDGSRKTWSLAKIRFLWDEMLRKPAIHVDSLLGGSGSSRNQPETLLANLPYVEWARIDGKKHIAFVGKHTHPHGTLLLMDSIRVEKIRQQLQDNNKTNENATILVVTPDIRSLIDAVERATRQRVLAIEPGVYEVNQGPLRIYLTTQTTLPDTQCGTYVLVPSRSGEGMHSPVTFLGEQLQPIFAPGLNMLLKRL